MKHSIDSITDGIPNLGSYSGVLREMEEVLNDPQSTLSEVGKVIEKDPSLTARLLKLANSSFFGFPSRLETVSEAITLIGIQQAQDLICASTVIEIFEGVSAELVSMESFWKHSLACGVAARQLALERRVPKPEKFFVAGLLHDVGRLALYSRAPDMARAAFDRSAQEHKLLVKAETEILGFDHAEIGQALLRGWNYPANLVHAVHFHHSPMAAGSFQLEASLVHLADHLVNAMQLGSSGERFAPPLNARAWERINLTIDVLEHIVEAIDDQISAVESAFIVPKPAIPEDVDPSDAPAH
jgi:putative nucleotidyltransferase with HDIG domain